MTEPIRVLQVVTHMNRGGLETMLMNYYRHIDRDKVQFDFLVHRTDRADYDDEIESLGGKIYRLPRLVPWSSTYKNALNVFFSGASRISDCPRPSGLSQLGDPEIGKAARDSGADCT